MSSLRIWSTKDANADTKISSRALDLLEAVKALTEGIRFLGHGRASSYAAASDIDYDENDGSWRDYIEPCILEPYDVVQEIMEEKCDIFRIEPFRRINVNILSRLFRKIKSLKRILLHQGNRYEVKNIIALQDEDGPYWIGDLYRNGHKIGVTGNYYFRDVTKLGYNLG